MNVANTNSLKPTQDNDECSSPIVKVLQRHFRRFSHSSFNTETVVNRESEKKMVEEHSPTGLSNPFWDGL